MYCAQLPCSRVRAGKRERVVGHCELDVTKRSPVALYTAMGRSLDDDQFWHAGATRQPATRKAQWQDKGLATFVHHMTCTGPGATIGDLGAMESSYMRELLRLLELRSLVTAGRHRVEGSFVTGATRHEPVFVQALALLEAQAEIVAFLAKAVELGPSVRIPLSMVRNAPGTPSGALFPLLESAAAAVVRCWRTGLAGVVVRRTCQERCYFCGMRLVLAGARATDGSWACCERTVVREQDAQRQAPQRQAPPAAEERRRSRSREPLVQQRPRPRCKCGGLMLLRTAGKEGSKHLGRRFWGCPGLEGRPFCKGPGSMQWIDS